MVGMEFRDFYADSVIPIDETLLKSLSSVDQQRLTKARAYSSENSYGPDPLSDDENEEKKQEAKHRALVSPDLNIA